MPRALHRYPVDSEMHIVLMHYEVIRAQSRREYEAYYSNETAVSVAAEFAILSNTQG